MIRRLMVAIPAYTGMIHTATANMLCEATASAIKLGWPMSLRFVPGNGIVARARNEFIPHFLASDATDLIFIDGDVASEPGAICRLAVYDVDVVAGIYPQRVDPVSFAHVRWISDRPQLIADPGTGLLEVEGVPAGFLRISRKAIERMIAAYPHLKYAEPNAPDGHTWALFDHELIDGQYWGEDLLFCRRWRAIGGQVWVDPELKLHHIGNKTFSGSLGEWLRNRPQASTPTER